MGGVCCKVQRSIVFGSGVATAVSMEFLELVSSLISKAARWNELGLQLGLSPDELDRIRADSQTVEECLRKVLRKWYDRAENRTWEEVIAALRSPLLEENKLAEELRKKCTVSDPNQRGMIVAGMAQYYTIGLNPDPDHVMCKCMVPN